MENENNDDIITSENNDDLEVDLGDESSSDSEIDKGANDKNQKPPETYEAKLARLERQASQLRKKLGKDDSKPEPKKSESTSGLDETQLDYLDLKGISDSDEIDIIQKVVAKTGQTVRQALKDDYVIAKLESLRADKSVKNATPSSTKRGGNQSNDVATALAKFEQTGELPNDYALKTQVVNALVDKGNSNKPAWQ